MPGSILAANLSITITPPGGSPTSYTGYFAYSGAVNQLTINQQFGRQGDTAVLVLVDDWQGQAHPHFYIPVLSQVSVYDNNAATNLFAGIVTDPVLLVDGPNRNEWTLNCTDYTFYADNAVVHGQFNELSIDQIVIALTQQANCGITAVSTARGGFVAPAPVLTQVNLNYQTLSSAWRSLAQLASSSTPYGWYVDQNLELHFFDATTAIPSGVTFTTSPTGAGGGSYTEGHFALDSTWGYEWDGTSIRNRILVQGANQTFTANLKGAPTDAWLADGTATSWPLRYTVTGSPSLYIAGASTAVTVVTGGGSSTAAWSVQQNAFGQWFLIALTAPSAGTLIQIWYTYQAPVIAQASDYPSQQAYTGPNSGVYTEYISDSSLSTADMALARAARERTEYAFAAERVTFNTGEEFAGWVRAGETFGATMFGVPDARNSYAWGLTNAEFLAISNMITFTTGGYRSMRIQGVRL
jgi:hypothetical protein